MYNKVKHPMGKNRDRNPEGRLPSEGRAGDQSVDECASRGPENGRQEAVRVRHVVEIERIGGRYSGNDSDLLDAEQDERRPENIQQLDGEKEDPERDGWVDSLDGEGRAIVPDEHGWGPFAGGTRSAARDRSHPLIGRRPVNR